MKLTQISFGSGEISPEMQGRLDARQYQFGVATCRNFIVRPQGVVDRRPGLRRCGDAYSNTYKSRLIPFTFSDEQSYVLEFSEQRGRIWVDGSLARWSTPAGGQVESIDVTGSPHTLTTSERHGLDTGDQIQFFGTNLLGLTAGASYTVTVADARTFSIGTTLSGPLSGTLRCHLNASVPADFDGAARTTSSTTLGASGDIVVTAHGFADNDVVRLVGAWSSPFITSQNYYVSVVSADKLRLSTSKNGKAVTYTGAISAGLQLYRRYLEGALVYSTTPSAGVWKATGDRTANVAVATPQWEAMPDDGIYSFDLPYLASDLAKLTYTQSNDVMTLAHPDYPPRELVRYGLTHWSSSPVSFSPNLATPSNLAVSEDRGDNYVIFNEEDDGVLTQNVWQAGFWVGDNGGGAYTNPATTGAPIDKGDTVYVEHVSGTQFENFPADGSGDGFFRVYNASTNSGYRKLNLVDQDNNALVVTNQLSHNGVLNLYVSSDSAERTQSYKVTAVDSARSESLPQTVAEVANNVLEVADASNTLTWDAVPGAVRYRVYREYNGLYGLLGEAEETTWKDDNTIEPDMGITPPIEDTDLDGSLGYPRAVAYFEQRRVFGGTSERPRNIYMTRSGTEGDLSYSLPIKDTDRISAALAAREATVIRHIVPMQDMLLLTQQGEWRLFTVNSDAIAPETIAVRQQSEIGANLVQPITVNNVVAYAAARGGHVYSMAFNLQNQGYATGDLSLRASHLFDNYELLDATFQKSPYPIMWWVSSSNRLLACTYIPEEQVAGWHQHDSGDGVFESVCSIAEGQHDSVYVSVVRDGARSIERIVPDIEIDLQDSVFCDAAVVRNGYSSTFTRGASLTFDQSASHNANDTIRVTATDQVFSSADVGSSLHIKVGQTYRAKITAVVSGTQADVSLEQSLPRAAHAATVTTWGFATQTVDGLDHLEGHGVDVVADGVYAGRFTVAGGRVSLPATAARWVCGLPYDSDLQTLPQVYQVEGYGQGVSKNVRDVWMRLIGSAGLQVGPSASELVSVSSLTTKDLKTGEFETSVPSEWTQLGQMLVRQTLPLPATIVNLTMLTEIGG